MDIVLLLTVLGILVTLIIGVWQIYLAQKQVKQGEQEVTQMPSAAQNLDAAPKNPYKDLFKKCNSLDELLRLAIKEIEKTTLTDYNQIFLSIPDGHVARLVAVAYAIPYHKQRYEIATFSGLLGTSFSSGESLNVANVAIEPKYFPAVLVTKSELVVPIKTMHTTIGVINSESEELAHYDMEICQKIEDISFALGEMLPVFGWSSSINELPKVHMQPTAGYKKPNT